MRFPTKGTKEALYQHVNIKRNIKPRSGIYMHAHAQYSCTYTLLRSASMLAAQRRCQYFVCERAREGGVRAMPAGRPVGEGWYPVYAPVPALILCPPFLPPAGVPARITPTSHLAAEPFPPIDQMGRITPRGRHAGRGAEFHQRVAFRAAISVVAAHRAAAAAEGYVQAPLLQGPLAGYFMSVVRDSNPVVGWIHVEGSNRAATFVVERSDPDVLIRDRVFFLWMQVWHPEMPNGYAMGATRVRLAPRRAYV